VTNFTIHIISGLQSLRRYCRCR